MLIRQLLSSNIRTKFEFSDSTPDFIDVPQFNIIDMNTSWIIFTATKGY